MLKTYAYPNAIKIRDFSRGFHQRRGRTRSSHAIFCKGKGERGVDHGELTGSWPQKICRRGQSMFWPPPPLKKVTFLHSKLLLDNSASFTSSRMKDMIKMEGITNFLRRLKQFDGFSWLTLTPVLYCRSTPLSEGKRSSAIASPILTISGSAAATRLWRNEQASHQNSESTLRFESALQRLSGSLPTPLQPVPVSLF